MAAVRLVGDVRNGLPETGAVLEGRVRAAREAEALR
jgi:hypothetical protein